jgi:hypothetical protein
MNDQAGSPELNNLSEREAGSVEATVDNVRSPTQVLPTDRISAEKQIRILAAFATSYAAEGQPVTNERAGKAVDMSGQTVVTTNAFFIAIGFLERVGPGQFKPTEPVMAFQRAYAWNPASAPNKLAPSFKDQWFGKTLISYLQLRRKLPKSEAIAYLAESCNALPKFNDQLRTLLDLMKEVGIIQFDGDYLELGPEGMANHSHEQVPTVAPPKELESKTSVAPENVIPVDAPFMYLDRERKRKVVIIAPHAVTEKEFKRITDWLKVQLFVEDSTES